MLDRGGAPVKDAKTVQSAYTPHLNAAMPVDIIQSGSSVVISDGRLARAVVELVRRTAVQVSGVLLVLILTVSGAACGFTGGSDRPIVYVQEVEGNPDIYLIDPDGEAAEAEAVERGPGPELAPTWAPDGERMAFVVSEDGNRDVRVVRVDGSGGEFRVSPEGGREGNEGSPKWNEDGDQLAYVSEQGGQSDIYVAAFDDGDGDTGRARTTRVTSEESMELLGDWSPDGQWLVFARRGDDDVQGLWLRNPAGVNLLRLTDGADSDPVWSPDGDVIAFVRDDLGNNDIYLVRPGEGEDWRRDVVEERWLNSPEEEHSPAWAPDGDTLVFVSDRHGNWEIYTADTREDDAPVRLTINEADDTEPVWSPDGERIAFVSDLFGETEILVMDADGSNQQRLTHNEVKDHSPDW